MTRPVFLLLVVACTGVENPADTGTPPDTDTDTGILPACADEGGDTVPLTIVGSTVGQGDDMPFGCGESRPPAADDYTIAFTAPADALYAFSLQRSPSDPDLLVIDRCDGYDLGCSNDLSLKGLVVLELSAGDSPIVIVDGGNDFVLDIFEVSPRELDCTDGLDNDADRRPDCIDTDCAGDAACVPECPDEVGFGAPASITTSTFGETDDYQAKCNPDPFPRSDSEVLFTAPSAGSYAVQVTGHGFRPFVAVLDACEGVELACGYGDQAFAVDLAAGETVLAVVDGEFGNHEGVFTVGFFEVAPSETSCSDGLDNDLLEGTDCADPSCGLDPACIEDCSNGADDDRDFLVDCDDPSCDDEAPCVETSCSDGVDDDDNGRVDCADPDCDTDPICSEDCANQTDDDLDSAIDCLDGSCIDDPGCVALCPDDTFEPDGTAEGSAIGRPDLVTPSCRIYGAPASDWSVAYTAPADGRYEFTSGGSVFASMVILDGCGGAELGCDAPEYGFSTRLAVDLLAGQTAIVVIESYDPFDGSSLTVAALPSEETLCSGFVDEDHDDLTDCSDPDCAPDPACAEDCADGADDNGNGLVDCSDRVCDADPACASVCPEEILAGALPLQIAGSTIGQNADQTAICGNGAPGGDLTWEFVAPATATYTFDTLGSSIDTVLSVLDGCGGPALACNDDVPGQPRPSRVEVPLVVGQAVIVVVDAYLEDGDFLLNVQ